MAEFFDKKTLVSEFNEAAYQIARLNVIWSLCNSLSRSGSLNKYKWLLDRAWIELSADANKKDPDKYFKQVEKLNKDIAQAKGRERLYSTLQDKEIFLRLLQDDVGKGSKRGEEYDKIF